MISKELAKKIRYLQIYTTKAVNDVLAGEYHSVFKGRGMEFDEVREYTPGDEIRTIDWNVTARMGHPFVKRYVEERELTVLLMLDASGSADFGTKSRFKREVAAEMGALLAFSAIKNNDRVGAIVFTEDVEMFIPPRKGRPHVLRVIRDLLADESADPLSEAAELVRTEPRGTFIDVDSQALPVISRVAMFVQVLGMCPVLAVTNTAMVIISKVCRVS